MTGTQPTEDALSKNNHKVALAILDKDRINRASGQPTFDKDLMIWWLAKNYPAIFIRGARAQEARTLKLQIDSYVGKDFVEGIKVLRNVLPGLGLAEGKKIVDQLREGRGPVTFPISSEHVPEVIAGLKGHFLFECDFA